MNAKEANALRKKLTAMTTAELIALYNENSDLAPIKRFSTKAQGVRRTFDLLIKGGGRRRIENYEGNEKITFLVDENPKRPGTECYKRFSKYRKAKTVAQAIKLGATTKDIRWDANKGYLKVEAA